MGLFSSRGRRVAPVEEDVDATVARLLELAQQPDTIAPAAVEAPAVAPALAPFRVVSGLRFDADGRAVLPRAAEEALVEGYRVCGASADLVLLEHAPGAAKALLSATCARDELADEAARRTREGCALVAVVDRGDAGCGVLFAR